VFSDDDDIVACPVCGAPHHRDCWQKEGHCHYTDKHAEGFVWKREETVTPPPPIEDEWDEEDDEDFDEDVVRDTPPQEEDRPPRRCRRCGFANPPYADFCSRCGAPLTANPPRGAGYGEYAPFQAQHPPYGGVDPNEQLAGETAEDMAAYVRVNTPYYLPRFRDMEKTGRAIKWNWGAFFFGPAWLLFRKRYIWGAILTVLEVLTQVLMLVSQDVLPAFYEALYTGKSQLAMDILQNADYPHMLLVLMPMVTYLLLHLLCGLFGTRLYMQGCAHSVGKMRRENAYGYKAFLPTQGGVSFLLALIGIWGVEMIAVLIHKLIA
jgi:hypothetical protein